MSSAAHKMWFLRFHPVMGGEVEGWHHEERPSSPARWNIFHLNHFMLALDESSNRMIAINILLNLLAPVASYSACTYPKAT
jgi:hypothetical protein